MGEKKEKAMSSKLGVADGSETGEWGCLGRRGKTQERGMKRSGAKQQRSKDISHKWGKRSLEQKQEES